MNAPFVPQGFTRPSAWPFGHLKPLHYRVVVLDPPWKFNGGTKGRPQHYRRMSDAEIAALPLRALAHPKGCWFPVWITSWMDGARFWENIWPSWKAQGLSDSGRFISWMKLLKEVGDDGSFNISDIAMGNGFTSRKCIEDVLLFKIGSPKIESHSVLEALLARRREHSRKPDQFYDVVRQFAPGPYADVFSREEREGWDCFGDELDKFTPAQGRLL